MANSQRPTTDTMRPNIRISHTLNGRVKDYAAEHDLTVDAAYREIIEAGIADLQARENAGEKPVETPPADTLPPALDDAIAAWQPDKQIATATARAALRDAVTWLAASDGAAKKAAIVDGAWPGEPSVDTWWGRAVRPGLAALAEQGLVDRPTNKTYRIEEE